MNVLLLSGGLDSAVLLASEVRNGLVFCIGFDYGQRHKRELEVACMLAAHYGCRYVEWVLSPDIFGNARSALTSVNVPVPYAHYADPAQASTVVPNRNMVLISLAASLAVQIGASEVLYSAHAGDHAIYADCRPEFVAALDQSLRLGCGVGVRAPFVHLTKQQIAALGRELGVPLEWTWSCYEGGVEPCGRCGACLEREEALA